MITRHTLGDTYPIKKLGEIAEFLDHLRKPVRESDRIPGPYPYYGANGKQGTINEFIFNEPLVLLAEDGGHFENPSRGIAYKINGKSWVNNHAHVLRPRPGVDADYLCRVLENYDVTPWVTGTTRGKLTKAGASEIEIPLPLPAEQRRIAEILDKADALRAKRREAIAKLDQLLQSVFLEMFGDPVTNSRGWPLENLAEATFFQEGPGILAKDFRDSGVPLVRLAGMGDEKVSLKGCNFVDKEIFERKWSQFALSEGDILVLTSATFGKPAVVDKETAGSIFYTGIIRFRSKHHSLSAEFLKSFLGSRWFLRQAQRLASGSVIKHFGPTHLKKMHIPIPPLELQLTFAQIADYVTGQKIVFQKSIERTETLFASLQHRAFEGSL